MAIGSVDYAPPVQLSDYTAGNRTNVDDTKKNVDSQRPKFAPDTPTTTVDLKRPDTDPVKVAAAKEKADVKAAQVTGYSAAGARTAGVETGTFFSLIA